MEYHQDRFVDFSLLVFKNEKLVALFPASLQENLVVSHGGLTYGGLILKKNTKLNEALFAFQAVLRHYHDNGIKKLLVKQLPSIYSIYPSEELDYAAFIFKANISRVDTSSTIALKNPLKIQKNRMEGVKKAANHGLILKEETTFDSFWNSILVPNLKNRHDAAPVHSVEEITQLKQYFPQKIKQFNVYQQDKIVAGATIFEMPHLVHVQYISSNDDRQQLGALDFLFNELITKRYAEKEFFDFGISNENQGRKLNEGLLYWKECFGARTVVHRFFEFDTAHHNLLDSVWT